MKLISLEHAPFEKPGLIGDWAWERDIRLESVPLYAQAPLPALKAMDGLVILGGPFSVQDEDEYPWLVREKEFIEKAIDSGKPIIGVCLGSQLLAEAMGAPVYPNSHKEIGWFDIEWTDAAKQHPWLAEIPARQTVFQWHGDTYDIPAGAMHLASSEACPHQGFLWNDQVLALQFHLEMTAETIDGMLLHCSDELVPAKYVMDAESIKQGIKHIPALIPACHHLLDQLFIS